MFRGVVLLVRTACYVQHYDFVTALQTCHAFKLLILMDFKHHRIVHVNVHDRSIHVCSVASASSSAIRTFTGHTDEVNGVCWSPGGIFLASCSDDSTAKIWSLEAPIGGTGLLHDLRGHSKEIYTVRWTPTGPCSSNPDKPLLLCTASFDGTVKVRTYGFQVERFLILVTLLSASLKEISTPAYFVFC